MLHDKITLVTDSTSSASLFGLLFGLIESVTANGSRFAAIFGCDIGF
jgi:hypothetical protein